MKEIKPHHNGYDPHQGQSGQSNFLQRKKQPEQEEEVLPFVSAKRIGVQPKLTMGAPNDPYEQEADRMADFVMRKPNNGIALPTISRLNSGTLQRQCSSCKHNKEGIVQRKCAKCQTEESGMLQRQGTGKSGQASTPFSNRLQSRRGQGNPLSPGVQQQMEGHFNTDFSQVRVHADSEANSMSQDIHAQAFTHGSDVYFNQGKYNPGSSSGQRLLAHELTHTVQQKSFNKVQKTESSEQENEQAIQISGNPRIRESRENEVNLNYAFFYTGGGYGNSARVFFDRFYSDHIQVRASSFEAMFDRLYRDIRRKQRRGQTVHIDEIVIVTHANSAGGLQIPLARGDVRRQRNFTPWDLAALQEEFTDRTNSAWRRRQRFRRRRRMVVQEAIDTNTNIVIRGCEFGQSRQGMEALRAFFGGNVNVWAPIGFQGYEVDEIGSSHIQNTQEAFLFLQREGFIPQDLELSPEEQAHYLAREMGIQGRVPSQFFIMGDENRERLREHIQLRQGNSHDAETIKVRGDSVRIETSGDFWGHSYSFFGFDPQLDSLSLAEIERRARILSQNYQPNFAPMLERLRRAWERNSNSFFDISIDNTSDPLTGLPPEDIFGDQNLIAIDVREYEDFMPDSFEIMQLPFVPPMEGGERQGFNEGFGDDIDTSLISGGERRSIPNFNGLIPAEERVESTYRQLAAARNFSKSILLAGDERDCEINTETITELGMGIQREELVRNILSQFPNYQIRNSEIVSAVEMAVNLITAPTWFVSSAGPAATATGLSWSAGAASLAALEGLGLFAPIVLSIGGFFVTLEDARVDQRVNAEVFGVIRGINRLSESNLNTLSFDMETIDEWMIQNFNREPRNMMLQIGFGYPLNSNESMAYIRDGMNSVLQSTEQAILNTERQLRIGLSRCNDIDNLEQFIETIRPVIRQIVIRTIIHSTNQMLRERQEHIDSRD